MDIALFYQALYKKKKKKAKEKGGSHPKEIAASVRLKSVVACTDSNSLHKNIIAKKKFFFNNLLQLNLQPVANGSKLHT